MQLAERALQHFTHKTTDQAGSTMEIPLSAYRDEAQYDREINRVFKRLPLAVALSLELPEAGRSPALALLGVPLLLVRGDDLKVRAMLNVCRHRGAKLCEDGAGNKRIIACPYHAWTYNYEGGLVGRYGGDTFGEIANDKYGLTRLHFEARAGIVWASLPHGDVFDSHTWLGDFGAELEVLVRNNWPSFYHLCVPGPVCQGTAGC